MATIGYLSIEGDKQGNISEKAGTAASIGNIWQEGHEDESLVFQFESNAVVPRDPNSGMPMGTRRHQPAVFTKPLDRASPLMWQALSTGEKLKINMLLYRIDPSSAESKKYYEIEWENATLVEGKIILPDTTDADNDARGHMEQWSFTFGKVTWKGPDNTEATDDWQKPAQG